jgi:hypothetical protein
MHAATWALVLCTAGVDVGWQPVDAGGLEYVIQLDADALDILASGREFVSEVPVQLGAVSRCRLKVGVGPVPRKLPAVVNLPAKSPGDVQQVEHREVAKTEGSGKTAAGPRALASLTPEPGPLPETSAEPLAGDAATAEAPTRPGPSWVVVGLAMAVLFASVAANAFLAWLVVSQRSRYRALTARIRSTLGAKV